MKVILFVVCYCLVLLAARKLLKKLKFKGGSFAGFAIAAVCYLIAKIIALGIGGV